METSDSEWDRDDLSGGARMSKGARLLLRRPDLGKLLLEGLDPLLHRVHLPLHETDVEESHVLRGRIQPGAVAEPRGFVHPHVLEAEILEDGRGLRGADPALAVDDRLLLWVELRVERLELLARLEVHAVLVGNELLVEPRLRVRIDPVLHVVDGNGARDVAAANGADLLAAIFLRRARVDDLHLRILEPSHHLAGVDEQLGAGSELERQGWKPRRLGADRVARGFPVIDAAVVDLGVGITEVLERHEAEVDIGICFGAVDDDFPGRIDPRRAQDPFDLFVRDVVLGVLLAQHRSDVVHVHRARNVSLLVRRGAARVPDDRLPLDRLDDIARVDDGGGPGGERGARGESQQRSTEFEGGEPGSEYGAHVGPPSATCAWIPYSGRFARQGAAALEAIIPAIEGLNRSAGLPRPTRAAGTC